VITRALGTDPDVDVDAFPVQARPGDVYLICSDGLSDMVDGERIEEIVRANRGDLDAAARALVQEANRAGGEDNITALLFEVVDDGAVEPDEATREHVAVAPVPESDDEDTLHPEDGVMPPTEAPAAVDTMVVPAEEIEAAMAAQEEEAPQAGIGRRLLALLVICALIAVIVVLVWWGLAR